MFNLGTKINHPDIALKAMPYKKWPGVFFMIYSFFTIFLVFIIIASIFYINYKKHFSVRISELNNEDDYSRIIQCCTDKNGLISFDLAGECTRQYLMRGRENLDVILAQVLQYKWENSKETPMLAEGLRETGCKFLIFFKQKFVTFFY